MMFGESTVFLFYAGLCFCGTAAMYKLTLETKDKTNSEVKWCWWCGREGGGAKIGRSV